MQISFDDFLVGILEHGFNTEENKINIPVNKQLATREFRKILDRMSKELINKTFENEKLVDSLMLLPRIGRIIMVFNIALGMELPEISYLLDISLESVYTQKNKALKKLRQNLNY